MKTSIIIPVYNNIEMTKQCIESIRKNTSVDYEIIIADDGSNIKTGDEIMDIFKSYCIKHKEWYFWLRKHRGFIYACNFGYLLAKGEFVLFLNNDTILTPNWLDNMLKYFDKIPNLGAVGCKTNEISGIQKDCLYDSFEKRNLNFTFKGNRVDCIESYSSLITKHNKDKFSPWPRIVGFCMLLKREVCEKIKLEDGNLFDERFGMGNFEDDDLCLRLLRAGYINGIAEDVFIYHYGSVSFKKDPKAYSKLLQTNAIIFKDKWGESSTDIWDRIINGGELGK